MTENEFHNKAEKTLQILQEGLAGIRTSRANPSLVENIMIDYYGAKTPLVQAATITSPEPRLLVVQPWDKSVMKTVEAAIASSDLGVSPVNDGEVLRIPIPPLTEERRKEFVKVAGKRLEEAKIALRGLREEYMKDLRGRKDAGALSEDEAHREEKALQERVNDYQERFTKIAEEKEKEILIIA
jgi:ribosome recycling factor